MKVLTASLLALSLVSSAATAAQFADTHRNARVEHPASTAQQIEVKAGTVLTGPELARAGLKATDLVTVTSFPSSESAQLTYER